MQVTDEVTVMYTVTPADHSLAAVILRHQEYIQTACKTPIRNGGISDYSLRFKFCIVMLVLPSHRKGWRSPVQGLSHNPQTNVDAVQH